MAKSDDIAARISAGLAGALSQGHQLRAGVEENLQALVQSQLQRLDLVTREEFDTQRALLRQAEQRLTALEAEIARLQEAAAASEPEGDRHDGV